MYNDFEFALRKLFNFSFTKKMFKKFTIFDNSTKFSPVSV